MPNTSDNRREAMKEAGRRAAEAAAAVKASGAVAVALGGIGTQFARDVREREDAADVEHVGILMEVRARADEIRKLARGGDPVDVARALDNLVDGLDAALVRLRGDHA